MRAAEFKYEDVTKAKAIAQKIAYHLHDCTPDYHRLEEQIKETKELYKELGVALKILTFARFKVLGR